MIDVIFYIQDQIMGKAIVNKAYTKYNILSFVLQTGDEKRLLLT